MNPTTTRNPQRGLRQMLLLVLLLLLAFAPLFYRSFEPGVVLFSNDGPLSAQKANYSALPAAFGGIWQDLNWLGGQAGAAGPSLTYGLLYLLGPVGYAKYYEPITLIIFGLCALVFFRQLGLNSRACILGGLAAAFNSNVFSHACWGLGSRATTMGMAFLALAAVHSYSRRPHWAKLALAGLAVGMGIMEGYDVGAILSLYVAAYLVYVSLRQTGSPGQKLTRTAGRLVVVVLCSLLMAAQALSVLTGVFLSQGSATAGASRDQGGKEGWNWATQWSLPKKEVLRVVVPGLFGYRMDTPEGGNYWGRVGQVPDLENQPQGGGRSSGAGEYAGVLVVLVALWSVTQALRRQGSVFETDERKLILFWAGVVVVSLLFAFGRFAPFYQIIYSLPYFSTIRNPLKFMHPVHISLLILFGYGIHGLSRAYLSASATPHRPVLELLKLWWTKVSGFDKKWARGLVVAVGVAGLGWLLLCASSQSLRQSLTAPQDSFSAKEAAAIVAFSTGEVAWSVFFLAASALALALVMSGALAGARARWAGLILGLVLVTDLFRADLPWIQYYNYNQRYASNPVIDALRQKTPQYRVTTPSFLVTKELSFLPQFVHGEWLQHHFQYYNIQALENIQMPRPIPGYMEFMGAFQTPRLQLRLWELTSSRFLLAPAGFLDALNQELDPGKQRFRIHIPFTLSQDAAGGPIQTTTNDSGSLALMEFSGALPRASLYSQWEVTTNGQAILAGLADPSFDPAQKMFVSQGPASSSATNGTATLKPVEYLHYQPTRIELRTSATVPTMLLVNDKYDPNWKVLVDGKTQPLLVGNYIMRAVSLPPGEHQVTMSFSLPKTGLYLSLGGLILGLLLGGVLWLTRPPAPGKETTVANNPTPSVA